MTTPTNTSLLLLAQIARRKITKSESLPDLARFANIDTLQLIALLDSKEFSAALNVSRRQYADHVAEQLGIEISGDSDKERFLEARKYSRDLPVFSKHPDGWD